MKPQLAMITVALIAGLTLANTSLADSDMGVAEFRGVFAMPSAQSYGHAPAKKNFQVCEEGGWTDPVMRSPYSVVRPSIKCAETGLSRIHM